MEQRPYQVLLIDDDEDDYILVRERLREAVNVRYLIHWAASFDAGQAAMSDKPFDAVLVDYRLGVKTGIDLIRQAVAENYPAPIILLTGQGNYTVDMEALQAGAADYLNKGEINSSLLDRSIRYAMERKQHEAALLHSERALRESEGRFRVALSNVAIAVFSTDLDLRYTWFYSTAMGSMPEQFIGKRDDEILAYTNVHALLAVKQRVLAERITIRDEVVIELGDTSITLSVSIEPYYDDQGEMIGVIGALYDVTEQRRLERERIDHLTELEVQSRLTQFREQERQAIAREIHDGPVQNLSGLIFRLQYSQGSVQDPLLKKQLDEVQLGLQETVSDLREMMNELRPPSLIRFGVAKAIRYHLEDFQDKHPEYEIVQQIEAVDDHTPLSDQVKLNLYKIYHEAVHNVVQHAEATKIAVRLEQVNHHVVLRVEDNGKGLFGPLDLVDHTLNNHYGLAGMKERTNLIGGELEVSSQPGVGMVIQVRVPVENGSPG